jgi:hypothetical protein
LYQADPVSGSPVSDVKEVSVDLDKPIDDASLERILTPKELNKVKTERKKRSKLSGPNNSIMNS